MTDHTPDLPDLDAAAARGSSGLRHHVDQHLDVERGLATLPTAPRTPANRSRLLAVAAVVTLLAGLVASVDHRDGDTRSRLEVDEDGNALPVPQPGVLTPLGPSDGKNSIRLPITIDPVVGLVDGSTVTVTGEGFAPGEQVGIVQCAREAGGDSPETAGGIDACTLNSVQYADADADGVAVGRFTVRRVLTTALTGTVDCAAEADRCLVGMGAISDYDRSGGAVFAIAGGEPIDIPELAVSPTEGLADGDTVHLTGSGFAPFAESVGAGSEGSFAEVSLCSTDPSMCWGLRGTDVPYGVRLDAQGRIDADVTVYRFLPGPTPGSYIDCAVSRCSLRVAGNTAPPPVRLSFTLTDDAPVPPALAVDPSTGLATGDTVVIRGAGFNPGDQYHVSLCAAPAGSADPRQICTGEGQGGRIEGDGGFAIEMRLPSFGNVDGEGFATATTACTDDGVCEGEGFSPYPIDGDITCDGVVWDCAIVVEAYNDQSGSSAPVFAPAPVRLTYR